MCSRCESELEKKFHEAWLNHPASKELKVEPQYAIDQHRVDFALVQYQIAIEIDSKQYHSSAEAKMNDRQRDDVLRSKGWKLIHLWGPDVHWHPNSSVEIAVFMIQNMFNQFVEARKLIPNGADLKKEEKPYDHLLNLCLRLFNSCAIIVLLGQLIADFYLNASVIHSAGDEEFYLSMILAILILPYILKWWAIIKKHS